MKILGIDASHRNTGLCILEFISGSQKLKDIAYTHTCKTKIVDGVLNEIANVKRIIDHTNLIKSHHAVYQSACEVAHSGRSFASSRNVGITWGICLATNSEPYTSHQVRAMFLDKSKQYAKDKALAYLIKGNFTLTTKIYNMNDHEVDAACVAIYHARKLGII